jgi:hypothetical protein
MKFNDLVERLGVPARQVRYMISEGIIPEALESGRFADPWDERHVNAGLRAIDLQERGFAPAAVKLLMQGGHAIPLASVGPLVLSVDPSVDPADIDVEAALAEFASAIRLYVGRPTPTDPEPASED